MQNNSPSLQRSIGPLTVWALGVGYVISGMYFGWNLGLPEGGPIGLLIATLLVTLLYVTFVLVYAELACAIPRAGGAFVYAHRALGPHLGFCAGAAQIMEFVFAPPAIAYAIGAYINLFFPQFSPLSIAMAAYIVFTILNVWGVDISAKFAFFVTVLAVIELLIFCGVTGPSFSGEMFLQDPLPNGAMGIVKAIPYAIWFYLAIEGVANIAEEVKDPQRSLSRGLISAMATLVVLALGVFFCAVGVSGWRGVVYKAGSETPSDSPLPLAMAAVVGENHFFYHLLVGIGLFGLIASFHGILLVAGRATFEFGRVGYAPKILAHILPNRRTPAVALFVNMLIGFAALFTGKTSEIITMSVFGALTLYFLSTLSYFALKRKEPKLHRPFLAPLYPITPALTLLLSVVALGSMIYTYATLAMIFAGLMAAGYLWFLISIPASVKMQPLSIKEL